MRNAVLFIAIILTLNAANGQSIVHQTNNEAFLQNEVAEVHIQLHPNDLITLLGDSLYSDHHFAATFQYTSTSYSDTIRILDFECAVIPLEC